jgi:hypothetical protein
LGLMAFAWDFIAFAWVHTLYPGLASCASN